jgi:deoxyribodipyrimidine photo-lyase
MATVNQTSIFDIVPPLTSPHTALLDALGVPANLREFEPSHASALARAAHTSPAAYARTRNALDGGVTGLSP